MHYTTIVSFWGMKAKSLSYFVYLWGGEGGGSIIKLHLLPRKIFIVTLMMIITLLQRVYFCSYYSERKLSPLQINNSRCLEQWVKSKQDPALFR